MPETRERQVCYRCKQETNVVVDKYNRRVLATHGTYALGARKPFRPCKSSGIPALPVDPFEGFRDKETTNA
jgi:hypothetical protein